MTKPAHASVTRKPCCTEAVSVRLLFQCLYHGILTPVPEGVLVPEELKEMLRYVQHLQKHLVFLARGEVSTPIQLKGFTGEILKELQANLNGVIRNARQLTVGDFSSNAGNMGEISEALDIMGKALQTALLRLEQQKQDLTALSESLRREIDARIAVEENLRREQLRLQKLASTDPLTGLANRRHFFHLAARELERIRRTGSQACLAMLDIDHFKELNDTLGHAEGDSALTRLAKIITSAIRPYDIAGRYGGDEFIFLFPETSTDASHTILERLRDSVEKARISANGTVHCITVSIGLTELSKDNIVGPNALDQAITRADKALYQAKQTSRNHICIV